LTIEKTKSDDWVESGQPGLALYICSLKTKMRTQARQKLKTDEL
jgi:hypothetical protein